MNNFNQSVGKCVIINPKFYFIVSFIVLFACSACAQVSGQLPVNLKAFKAMAETNKNVKIFWTTEYEKDNAYFEIERSADGVNFITVGRLPGLNRHGILTDYYYYDYNALSGVSYYRLKQVDVDLKYSFSSIERVRNAETVNSVDVYPNPSFMKEFKINLLKNTTGNINVMVFDQSGRCCLKLQIRDNNTITVKHQLPAGIYNIKISGKELDETKTLLVE